MRAIRSGKKAYLVSIGGANSAWVKNIEANPNVRLRVRGGTFSGVAHRLREQVEPEQAMQEYCRTVNPFDYIECANWRKGRPTRSKIKELHRTWFDHGMPLVIELAER